MNIPEDMTPEQAQEISDLGWHLEHMKRIVDKILAKEIEQQTDDN